MTPANQTAVIRLPDIKGFPRLDAVMPELERAAAEDLDRACRQHREAALHSDARRSALESFRRGDAVGWVYYSLTLAYLNGYESVSLPSA